MKLEVFFDYVCPFCQQGHKNLAELLPEYPELELVWKPCEVHPRPESHGMHSDLALQAMFFAAETGADIWAFHERLYALAAGRQVNFEDADALAAAVADLLDADALRAALAGGVYAEIQRAGNDYAYEESGVWALPSYRMDGEKLDSVEGVGVPKEKLKAFLDAAK
jgi:predicted DsbA family dithiol-disulfide isomerase